MKRAISLVLCLILVLGLAATASAATVDNQTGHDYDVYQIFEGSQGSDASLGKIDWGKGVNGEQLLKDLTNNLAAFAGAASADDVATILAKKETSPDDIAQFTQLAYNNKTTKTQTIPANATEVELPAGYYLVVDVHELEKGDARNSALLQVTNAGSFQIQKKYDVPEAEKDVIANDPGDTTIHVDHEDSPIGSMVDFYLKAEMPLNMAGYEKYTMTFHDRLSEGLTFDPANADLKVTVGGLETAAEYYSVVTPDNCEHGCTFHVVIPDVMVIPGYEPGCTITVEYQAMLNENALINEGNPNNYRLEYSNDPNWDPEDPDSESPPTGITPEHEVFVYTTEVEILKVDGTTDQPLIGAEFTLEGKTVNKIKVVKHEFVSYKEGSGAVKYWKLTDGTYTTVDPTGRADNSSYEPPVDGVYAVYMAVDSVEFVDGDATAHKAVATVGADGIVKFAGLGEGTYTVTETKVPDGYNGLKAPMQLTIVYHETQNRYEYSWTGGATGSGASIQVDNMKGSVLPETGGIGTTLFYVIGGLLVAGSAVLLVTKKRMAAE